MSFLFDSSFVGPWICEKSDGEWDGEVCIGYKNETGMVVGVMYDQFTGSNICAHIRCDQPSRVPPSYYATVFDYPFNQLKVKRITLIIKSKNSKARNLAEHLGFSCDAKLRDYFPEGDAIVYVMFKDSCRFLEKKYGQKCLSAAST